MLLLRPDNPLGFVADDAKYEVTCNDDCRPVSPKRPAVFAHRAAWVLVIDDGGGDGSVGRMYT